MSLRKRKKYSKDIKCVFFPDELIVQKGGKDTALSVASTVKSWEKCGDSFLDTPVTKPKSSGKTFSAIRKLSQALALDPSVAEHDKEPVHIAWSNSDESEDETKEQNVLQVIPKKRSSKTKRSPFQSYTSALNLLTDNDEEPPVIDTDSDIVQSEEEVERESVQQISDCGSNVSSETLEETASNPTNPLELEISGYESDETNDRMTFSTMDSGEGRQRFVSHWLRSAQAILQTPQKATEKQSKTPEDSAKKRKKFQSGGLAERLHRLQCRQRSAISFWRHKSVSENATTVDRPGVLVLEVLEVQEECSMRLVRCEHYTPPTGGHHRSRAPFGERAPLLVLFNKETTAQLNPLPKDIIHIYPPWQSLSVEGMDYDIILNTHFSQKVSCSSELAITSLPSLTALKRTPYPLDKVFGLDAYTAEEHNNKLDIHLAIGDSLTGQGRCQSLLDAIEALGQAGSIGQTVEVVVQRVYSIPVPDSCSGSILKHRIRSSNAPPAAENRTRLCVLVQDSYGMFSVVQLHLLASKDDLQRYCQMWQGQTCQLKAIKVVQRVTRERHARLFGLIDSLWPPLVPLKHHGSTASLQNDNRVVGPPPSFCYLLCGQETSVETSEDQSVSPLYFPPAMQTLKELMQSEQKSCRCSFVAVVLYSKKQKANVGQDEMWLAVTDPSLQAEQLEGLLRRTVTVCVTSSCVLASSVLEALNQPSACHMSFRDVIKEHGMFLCAEQSVIELCPLTTESSVQSSLGSLDKPVRLDALDWGVTPSSLCTVSGVIVGVDENTAYSWPSCNHCGSDHLEMLAHQRFHCVSCESILDKPETKVQLEVILSESSLKDWTIKIKLQKKTIFSLLNISAPEGGEFPGYDVVSVLGKELGPLNAYVRLITRKPSLWIGLEEISL